MGIFDFAARSARPDLNAAINTISLSEIFLGSVDLPSRIRPSVPDNQLFGVALVRDQEADSVHPTLLVDRGLVGSTGQLESIEQVPMLAAVVSSVLGARSDWYSRIRVMGITPFEEQLAPGDVISASKRGIIGCGVQWPNGYGFLTAGHVASIGSRVVSGGNQIGSAVYSNDPAGHGLRIEEDAAVVELHSPGAFHRQISGMAVAGVGDSVIVQSPQVTGNAQIQGYATFFNSPKTNATYGELYLTYGQVTQPGDSGATVLDRQGAIIGHVIGGSPRVFSYIQDIHYQMRMIGSNNSFAGIRLW